MRSCLLFIDAILWIPIGPQIESSFPAAMSLVFASEGGIYGASPGGSLFGCTLVYQIYTFPVGQVEDFTRYLLYD